jgi:hypothetical protein
MQATVDALQRYKNGYLCSLESDGAEQDVKDMIEGWEEAKHLLGEARALEAYWAWQKTLPEGDRSDCDPDGGI